MNVDATKARSIFTSAVEDHAPDQWEKFLDDACGENTAIRRRVELLLKAHQGEDGFLDRGDENEPADATIDQPITEKPGTQIGPYKLLQKVGEGGMGVVYMAEQKEPVKRRVALKIIKPGMDTRQVIARFEAERQALAMMDHPNIAKVLDAGQTSSGRPYFVMELVNGISVTQYCDEQHLTPKERLELFVPICQAVQHAHQKGVIHRDLKPSNILVALYDGQAVPKVIDFGVAKATSQTLTEKTMFTQLGQVVGTLEYMSPEQAERNQLDVDTRSDVYSLGVVLYELLTGDTPFDRQRLRSAAFDEMLRIIREEVPSKPSAKVSSSQSLPSIAANRRIEPARLSSTIRGDLDWIVMRALEKDRLRRYDTASAFSEDIVRYLGDEAVLARSPSPLYRFRKFARRNRALMTTATSVTLALFISLIGIFWQLARVKRAEQIAQSERQAAETEKKHAINANKLAVENLGKARAAVNEFVKISAKLSGVSGTERLHRELIDSALRYYEDFLQSNGDNSELQADLASAHLNIGRLKKRLGSFRDALTSYKKAEAILKTSRQDAPGNPRFKRTLASVHFENGWVRLQLDDVEGSVTSFNTAVQLRSELVDKFSEESDQLDLARDYHNLAIAVGRKDGFQQAWEIGEKSLKLARQLLEIQPSSYTYRTRVARTSGFLGAAKARMGLWGDARSYMQISADIHEQLIKERPNDRDCQRRVAVAADWLAQSDVHNKDYESALQQINRAIEIGEDLVESFPITFRYRIELADHYLTLAWILDLMGQRPQTRAAYQKAIASFRVVAAKTASFSGLLRALSKHGINCLKHRDYQEAVVVLRDQLNVTVQANSPQETRKRARAMLGEALAKRGLELLKTNASAAERDLEQGAAYLEDAYSELRQIEDTLSNSSKQQVTEILALLVEIFTDWKRPQDAKKWQAELDKRKDATR